MKKLFKAVLGVYLVSVLFLTTLSASLVVLSRFAEFVPVLLLAVAFVAAAYRWARGDWG